MQKLVICQPMTILLLLLQLTRNNIFKWISIKIYPSRVQLLEKG